MHQDLYPSGLPDPQFHPDFYRDVTSKRFFAWIIDVIIISILTIVISTVTIVGLFIIPLVFLAVDFLYRAITIASGSATLGMRVMSVELRTYDGERLSSGMAAMHTLLYMVSFGIFLAQIATIFLMITSPRGQGLVDRLLGVVAINRAAR